MRIRRKLALVSLKAVHSLLYFSIEFCMGYLIYSGLKGREDRRTAIAASVVVGESLIFLGNRYRCPSSRIGEESWSHERLGDRYLLTTFSCGQPPSDPRAVARFGTVSARQELSRGRSRA
jgi:hypothetical protein